MLEREIASATRERGLNLSGPLFSNHSKASVTVHQTPPYVPPDFAHP